MAKCRDTVGNFQTARKDHIGIGIRLQIQCGDLAQQGKYHNVASGFYQDFTSVHEYFIQHQLGLGAWLWGRLGVEGAPVRTEGERGKDGCQI